MKENKNIKFIREIEYNDKKYIKALKLEKKKVEYIYFEKIGEELKKIEDKVLLEYLKTNYEIKPSKIIY